MRIQNEDDLVVVINKDTNEVLYKGLEDYEDCKYEDWLWNDLKGQYEWKNLIKRKVA